MSTRSLILSLTCLLLLPFALLQAEKNEKKVIRLSVQWNEEISTPAICLGVNTWFVSVIPNNLENGGAKAPRISTENTLHSAKILFTDEANGLCLIETESEIEGVTPSTLAKSGKLRAGLALHCRSGNKYCRTTIAGRTRTGDGKAGPSSPLIRVRLENPDAFCRPGMPLFNPDGEVVGVLTGREEPDSQVARAIPVPKLRKLIREFEVFRKSGSIRLGVLFEAENTTPEVHSVRPGSPAARSGIVPGDIFLRVNGAKVHSFDDLADICAGLTAGKETKVTVIRGVEKVQLVIVPEFRE